MSEGLRLFRDRFVGLVVGVVLLARRNSCGRPPGRGGGLRARNRNGCRAWRTKCSAKVGIALFAGGLGEFDEAISAISCPDSRAVCRRRAESGIDVISETAGRVKQFGVCRQV